MGFYRSVEDQKLAHQAQVEQLSHDLSQRQLKAKPTRQYLESKSKEVR